MNWVAEGLALGNWQDARAASEGGTEIEAIFQLFGPDPRPELGSAVLVKQVETVDGHPFTPELVQEAVTLIRTQRELGRAVLVRCGAGMSRSPSMVAAYLCETGMTLREAFRLIIAARRSVLPHPVLVRCLVDHYSSEEQPEQLLADLVRFRSGGSG